MTSKAMVWIVLFLMISSGGCIKKPNDDEMRENPAFYVLTPIDFPPDYELDDEEVLANQSPSIKGFYISMKFKRYDDRSVMMTWTNIGYVFEDPMVQERNLDELMELVFEGSQELDPPVVGDKNYFYYVDDPGRPGWSIYTFIYDKDNAQGFVSITTRGVSENEVRRILNTLKMKIA